MAALFDASRNAIEAASDYGKQLTDQDYSVNAITFVITDGMDNVSSFTAKQVGDAKTRHVKDESLESHLTVLIGVGINDPQVSSALKNFETTGQFDRYIELDKADKKTLAKLSGFVSKSVSSQSQALGTGGPSKAIASMTC